MAINSAAFSSTPISQAGLAVIQILSVRPDPLRQIEPPETPGKMVGFYNTQTDKVELYVASAGGSYWVRCS